MSRQRGFTLIELLITVVVAAILVGLAAPNISETIKENRKRAQVNELFADLVLVRSETVKRGASVFICSSANGTSCGGAATDWSAGRLMWVDLNSNDALDVATDPIVKYTQALGSGNRLIVATVAATNFLSYKPDGLSSTSGSFTICDPQTSTKGRSVTIAITGRATLGNALVNCP